MKSSDIKVGEQYAFKHRPSAYTVNRVKVLEVGVRHRVIPRDSYRAITKDNGVKVEFFYSGTVEVVDPKTITETWLEHLLKRRRNAAWKREREQHENGEMQRRAKVAYALHEALVAKGAKVGLGYTYSADEYAALKAAGFKPVERDGHRPGSHFESTIHNLSSLVGSGSRDGVVDIETVAVLLGLSEPEESLEKEG